jgi:hypothetical protein
MGFSVTHSDGSVTRHDSYEGAVSAANASAARSGGAVQDTTSRASSGGGSSGSNGSSANNVDRPSGSGGGSSNLGYSTNSPSAANFARPAGQDARVDRNRQASAMYAAQEAGRGGAPVPEYLREYLPGGSAYDPARDRETFMGRVLGGVSDAIGNVLSGGSRDQGGLAPDRSPRPVPRGTPMSPPNFMQRTGDFLQGTRPLIGLGGVFNSEGTFADTSSSLSPNFDNLGQSSGDSVPVAPVVDPVDPSAPIGGTAEEDMGVYSPFLAGTATYAPVAGVSVVPGNDLLYEDYLARLMARNQLLQPLGITPLGGMPSGGMQMAGGISPLNQGIGSFAPPGFG